MKYFITMSILFTMFSLCVKSQKLDSVLFSECISYFNKDLLKESRDCYLEHDTSIVAIYMAAYISKQLNDLKSLKKLSDKLISKKLRSPQSYRLCAELYKDDSVKVFSIIDQGLKEFRKDTFLLIFKADYLLRVTKNYHQAIFYMDEALKYKKFANSGLFWAKGMAYMELGDNDNAIKNFKLAIDVNPKHLLANVNCGILHFNKAVVFFEQADKEFSDEKFDELRISANEELKKAMLYLEKADTIAPNNLQILNPLKIIYNKLNYNTKFQYVTNKINEIESQ